MRTVTLILKICFILFILSSYLTRNLTTAHNYFSLMSHVHQYYGTSCVFIVHSRQESDIEIHKIQNILRKFSSQSILSVAVEFRRLKVAMGFYSKRAVRSLVVVSLRTHEILAKFSNLISDFDMHLTCWLLLFEDEIYLKINAPKPGENIFNIAFDTELLVARSNHSIIQEWYWLNNKVKMVDFAVWDFENGFIPKSNRSLYRRRSNLEDTKIRVTSINNPPMESIVNETMEGLFGNVFKELSQVANCNVEFVVPNEMTYGSWNSETQKWSGVIQMLVDGEASIGAADFTITTLRLEWIDFSLPLISTRDKLYIRRPDSRICWSSYWQTLAPGNWIIIQILIFLTTIILTLITAVRRYKITPDVYFGYLLLVFGIYCQQGLPEFPIDLPSRITYFSIFLSALIVSAAYAATLTSFLTITGLNLPFSTLEEFVDDGTYGLIVFRDGAEYDMFVSANDPTMVKMFQMIENRDSLPKTLADAFLQVCQKRVAFYVPAALEESIRLSVPCQIVGIETKRSMSLAMAFSKGNPYHGLINYHVQRFRDHGILNRLKHEFTVGKNPAISEHADVTLWGVLPVLAILVGGILLACFILCIEKIIFTKQQRCELFKNRDKKLAELESITRSKEVTEIYLRNRGATKHLSPPFNFHP